MVVRATTRQVRVSMTVTPFVAVSPRPTVCVTYTWCRALSNAIPTGVAPPTPTLDPRVAEIDTRCTPETLLTNAVVTVVPVE